MKDIFKSLAILLVLLLIIFILGSAIMVSVENRKAECRAGANEWCTDRDWCEMEGGRYFGGGFGASRCIFPPSK